MPPSKILLKTSILCLIVFLLLFAASCLYYVSNWRTENSLSSKRRYSTRHNQQRVVLLAGPHKTSSSSIQLNLYQWLSAESRGDVDISGLSRYWAWPSPIEQFKSVGCAMDDSLASKSFYQFIDSIKGKRKGRCIVSKYSKSDALNLFQDEFQNKWREGYSLVIASEAFDFIASERRTFGSGMLIDVINSLPWHQNATLNGKDEDITAVVSYRTKRVEHLISLWHQCCMKRMSFYEYLTKHLASSLDPLKSLDSLKLAKIFLDHNLETILIDMSGVTQHGYDMSNVVACDVLNAECTQDKRFTIATDSLSVVANVKTHSAVDLNVTDSQLGLINEVIETYDCNFLSIVHHAKMKVLYACELRRIFKRCKNKMDTVKSREDMVQRIISIAQYGEET